MTIPKAEIHDGMQVMYKSPKHQFSTKEIAKEDRETPSDEEDGRECEENSKGSRKTGTSKGNDKHICTTGGFTRPWGQGRTEWACKATREKQKIGLMQKKDQEVKKNKTVTETEKKPEN